MIKSDSKFLQIFSGTPGGKSSDRCFLCSIPQTDWLKIGPVQDFDGLKYISNYFSSLKHRHGIGIPNQIQKENPRKRSNLYHLFLYQMMRIVKLLKTYLIIVRCGQRSLL